VPASCYVAKIVQETSVHRYTQLHPLAALQIGFKHGRLIIWNYVSNYTTHLSTGMADESITARLGLTHMSQANRDTHHGNMSATNLEKQSAWLQGMPGRLHHYSEST